MISNFRAGDKVKLNDFYRNRIYGGHYPYYAEKSKERRYEILSLEDAVNIIATCKRLDIPSKNKERFWVDFLELDK